MKTSRSLAWTVALTFAGFVAVVAGSWLIIDRGVERILQRQALLTAEEWAGYLATDLPRVERLIEGETTDLHPRPFIEGAGAAGDVFRWKLFDEQGNLRFDSRYVEALAAGRPLPLEARIEEEQQQEEVGQGWPHAYTEEGDGVTAPLHYAEAFDELVADGERIGFVEVYVDLSEEWVRLEEALVLSGVALSLLILAAVLVPLAGLLWQARRRFAADEAREQASRHDALTGVLNRYAFGQVVEREIARDPDRGFYVHAFNIARFRNVNETHGQAVGDSVLRRVAWRLQRVAGEEGVVCRLGSDEFAVLDRSRTPSDARDFAETCVRAVAARIDFKGVFITVAVDCGIAGYPQHGGTASALLNAADLALFAAAEDGPGSTRFFDRSMEAARVRRLEVEQRLRQAVEEGDFRVVYQPLWRLRDDRLAGFEALLRLDGAPGGAVSPAEFVPVAEDTGLIIPLGQRMVHRVCETAARWPEELSVAVNVSPIEFEKDGPAPSVRSALSASGLAPHRLEIEVTESTLIADPDTVALKIDRLKEMGVKIALDDFGTGYSSLSHIARFPFDKLKIDRSFVRALDADNARSRQMLQMIVVLGEMLGLEVTAEGIETLSQAEQVRGMKIDFMQGYLFGRPMDERDLQPLLRQTVTPAAAARGSAASH